MTKVPLYTSIPPTMRRYDLSGNEIGRDYQAACIRSWIDSGFDCRTVNSPSEFLGDDEVTGELEQIVFERDAREDTGKPLVYLKDLIDHITGENDGPIGITNADIELHFDEDMQRRMASLEPGEAFFMHRIDVSRPGSRAGVIFDHGIDFFGVHTADLRKIDVGQMVLGMPWWDHLVPILMLANGVRRISAGRPALVFHLRHDERWDTEQWLRYGKMFRRQILGKLSPEQHPAARAYLALVTEARTVHSRDLLKTAIQVQTRSGRRKKTTVELQKITRANIDFMSGKI